MRLLALIVITSTACIPPFYRDIGGTPGPPAVSCATGDEPCEIVQTNLEVVRRNIGGPCGTPDMSAYHALSMLGPAGIPYLLAAVHDRDEPVARMAAAVLLDVGGGDALLRRCDNSDRSEVCTMARKQVAEIREEALDGEWIALERVSRPPLDGAPARVSIAGNRGTVCDADHRCRPLTSARQSGRWMHVTWGERTATGLIRGPAIAGDIGPADDGAYRLSLYRRELVISTESAGPITADTVIDGPTLRALFPRYQVIARGAQFEIRRGAALIYTVDSRRVITHSPDVQIRGGLATVGQYAHGTAYQCAGARCTSNAPGARGIVYELARDPKDRRIERIIWRRRRPATSW